MSKKNPERNDIYLISEGKKSAQPYEVIRREQLAVGGREGAKYLVTMLYKKFQAVFGKKREVHLFEKMCDPDLSLKHIVQIIKNYDFLREKGFPVPDTIRYYQDSEKNWRIVLSDITENGKYKVWGYSDKMTFAQQQELDSMELNSENIAQIIAILDELVALANKNEVFLYHFYYHIRQNTETGTIDVVLLDISHVKSSLFGVKRNNLKELAIFLDYLDEYRKKNISPEQKVLAETKPY